jgi:hypothetical protein
MGLVDYVKQKTGIGQLVSGRKKQIDEAAGITPAPPAQPPSTTNVQGDGDAIGSALDDLDKKYGKTTVPKMAKGGVIDRTLLKRKAEVMKKRGC